jgi:diguanylate cyclase (GGDEF)-like protein
MKAAERRSPSLRRTWLTQTLAVGAVLTLIGLLALGASAYQREAFRDTTRDLERASSALVDLRTTLNDIDEPAAGVMYGLGGPDATAGHLASYQGMGREVLAGFGRLREAAPSGAGPAITQAQTHWDTMDAGVRAAPAVQASGAVAEALKTGTDPYAEVWAELGLVHEQLAEVERLNVVHLRTQAAAVDRVQSWIPGVLLAVLTVAMLGLVFGARRMSQRVVAPLAELRRAAVAMRGAGVVAPIDVRGASSELQVLAQTIEETAASLRVSHGELRDQARTDVLTGLPNRKAFVEELERRFALPDERLGVLFVDLDDFKVVNDSLGHAAGDELLQVVGARLRATVRQGDLVARLGGDEFAVLVSCAQDPAAAAMVAGGVLGALDEQVLIAGMRITIDCSVGVATAGTGVDSPEVLLRNADFAMYMAKGRGKNCVETFAPSMHLAMQLQSDFKRDLALAAVLDQLVLHHQPVLDLTSGRVLGFEALVRWEHPDRGLVPPMEFINLAEETGDILGIGKWVLEQACADLAGFRLEHPGQSLWMSVNVSGQQLADPGFVAMVLGTLAAHHLEPGSLVLELTEHTAVSNTGVANASLEALRSQGVRVALDDFGVGFSSLRYLRELPVDVLKIDRSFVIDTGDKASSMLSAVVSLAHKLDLEVIAEGIEEPEQLDRLQQLGPLTGQGYLFSRPVPCAEATLLLSSGLVLPAQRRAT